jgi:hypothetical protein
VVSVDLPDVRALHMPPVFVADHPENAPEGAAGHPSFLQRLEDALALASDPDRRRTYADQARAHAARFSWQGMTDELERRMGIGSN